MKTGIIICVAGLLAQQIIQAQGVVYLSNLTEPSTGSVLTGSNQWLAVGFQTGNNAGGYLLNSIQLAMTDAKGSPSGFTAMLYTEGIVAGPPVPKSSLGTLNGSLNPVTAGTYTYTPVANLTLSPSTDYFIVLTAGTGGGTGAPIAAYEWSYAGVDSYNPSGGWSAFGGVQISNNGLYWGGGVITLFNPQFAINATAVPEPSASWLLLLASGILICVRRAFRS